MHAWYCPANEHDMELIWNTPPPSCTKGICVVLISATGSLPLDAQNNVDLLSTMYVDICTFSGREPHYWTTMDLMSYSFVDLVTF